MSDLTELYQEIILDHNRRPRNHGRLAEANRHAEGYNPLCGDKIALDVVVDGGVVTGLAFQGEGCAISQASASVLTEAVQGRSVEEAEALVAAMLRLVSGDDAQAAEAADGLDEQAEALAAFAGVRDYPSRVKCATLAWHALREALAGGGAIEVDAAAE